MQIRKLPKTVLAGRFCLFFLLSELQIKKMREEDVKGLLKEEHLILAGRANIATMRFLADLLKKENGYPPRTLNILWTLCELAQVGRIAHAGKVIGDQALLRIAGFQAKEYTRLFKESIKHEIVKALRAGEDIEDVLNRI